MKIKIKDLCYEFNQGCRNTVSHEIKVLGKKSPQRGRRQCAIKPSLINQGHNLCTFLDIVKICSTQPTRIVDSELVAFGFWSEQQGLADETHRH